MARSFNGTSDLVTIGDVIDLAGSTTFTIAAWIYPTTIRAQRIISKWGAGVQYLMQMTAAGKLEAVVHDASGHQPLRDSVAAISANVWTHVAIQLNGSAASNLSLFIGGANSNGSFSGVAMTGGIQNTTQPLAIGDDAGASRTAPFQGRIAHAAIWSSVLSPIHVLSLSYGLLPTHVDPANLLAYWPLYGVASPEPAIAGSARTAGTLTGTAQAADAPVNPSLVDLW